MMKIVTLLLASLLAFAAVDTSYGAVQYKVTNNAADKPGGKRFNTAIGINYSKQVLARASSFIWTTFRQTKEKDRKNVTLITLTIESMNGVAYAVNSDIHMSAEYIGNYSGDVKVEFTGVMYHEVTHVWQWNGAGRARPGLIEGVADYVRLKAGYAPPHWVKPGEGSRWDQGYDVTARFLDYCDGLKKGFVAELNAKMKNGYSDDFFRQLLGKSVDRLWSDYKAKFASDPNPTVWRMISTVWSTLIAINK